MSLNIYQRLANVRKEVSYIQKKRVKDKEGKDTLGYAVVSSSLVLNPLNEAINKEGLFLSVEMINQETKCNQFEYEVWDKYQKMNIKKLKNEYVSTVNLKYTWVNIDNPEEKITSLWSCEAVNNAGDPAKSIGSALTYAEKYFLLKFFNVATDELDPDLAIPKKDNDIKEKVVSVDDEIESLAKNFKLPDVQQKGFIRYVNFILQIKNNPRFAEKTQSNYFLEAVKKYLPSFNNKYLSDLKNILNDNGFEHWDSLKKELQSLYPNEDLKYYQAEYEILVKPTLPKADEPIDLFRDKFANPSKFMDNAHYVGG